MVYKNNQLYPQAAVKPPRKQEDNIPEDLFKNIYNTFSHTKIENGIQGIRCGELVHLESFREAQNNEMDYVCLNLIGGGRTFVLQKTKFFQPWFDITK